MCVGRLYHKCHPQLNSSKLFTAPNAVPIFPASCHVHKSNLARLKLDFNVNNIVYFTKDHFLTGFRRDQAVKRGVTEALDYLQYIDNVLRRLTI
jgi:hypothetical protein